MVLTHFDDFSSIIHSDVFAECQFKSAAEAPSVVLLYIKASSVEFLILILQLLMSRREKINKLLTWRY